MSPNVVNGSGQLITIPSRAKALGLSPARDRVTDPYRKTSAVEPLAKPKASGRVADASPPAVLNDVEKQPARYSIRLNPIPKVDYQAQKALNLYQQNQSLAVNPGDQLQALPWVNEIV